MRDTKSYWQQWEDDETWQPRRKTNQKPKRTQAELLAELVEDGDKTEGDFNPSFSSSRHERAWIQSYLGPFYRDHTITDVLRQVKGGKEATVYCCKAHPSTGVEYLAAKVYRPRMFRSLSNDAQYRKGRTILDADGKTVRDGGELNAVAKKSEYGLELAQTSWLAHEFQTLQALWRAGADVPQPLARGENVILMEYVGGEQMAAPTLNHVTLEPEEALPLFRRLMENVELMLTHGRIHGDLSAFNVLYWEGKMKIIDFPQAVNPYENPDARVLLERDVTRLCQYFARYGVDADAGQLVAELWSHHIVEEAPIPLMEEELAALSL
ncbi:MAG TPA: RIO1 family regulatory kinase/ATPase [Ardenticatenaceae bacterium]